MLRHDIQKTQSFPGKLLNDAHPIWINICGITVMKQQSWQTSILVLGALLCSAGCGNQQKAAVASTNSPSGSVDKVKEQARNVVTATKDFLAQQKGHWQKSYSDKLSEFDKQLTDLKSKSVQAGDKARSEWSHALFQLEQKKQSAAQKLEQIKNTGTDKWQQLKTDAETSFADWEKAFNNTFSRLTNDDKSASR